MSACFLGAFPSFECLLHTRSSKHKWQQGGLLLSVHLPLKCLEVIFQHRILWVFGWGHIWLIRIYVVTNISVIFLCWHWNIWHLSWKSWWFSNCEFSMGKMSPFEPSMMWEADDTTACWLKEWPKLNISTRRHQVTPTFSDPHFSFWISIQILPRIVQGQIKLKAPVNSTSHTTGMNGNQLLSLPQCWCWHHNFSVHISFHTGPNVWATKIVQIILLTLIGSNCLMLTTKCCCGHQYYDIDGTNRELPFDRFFVFAQGDLPKFAKPSMSMVPTWKYVGKNQEPKQTQNKLTEL